MLELGTNNSWAHQLLVKMMQLPSADSNLLSVCEEEEADEPPDDLNRRLAHPCYHSDGGFKKQTVPKPAQHTSLLTQALTSPELAPVDRGHFGSDFRNGFSGTSLWSLSGASTAELTSDCGLSSRSHSPSPPHPPMVRMLQPFFHDRKIQLATENKPVEIADDLEVLEGLSRKRAIRFACHARVPPPRPENAESTLNKAPSSEVPSTPPKRNSTIKFVCSQRDDKTVRCAKAQTQLQPSPKIRLSASNASGLEKHRCDSVSTATGSTPKAIRPPPSSTPARAIASTISPSNPATRFYEFASSVEETESWMQVPPYGSRPLRVDGVLEKEEKIRKLTQEAEEEANEEVEDEPDVGEDEEEPQVGVGYDDEDDQGDEFDAGDYDEDEFEEADNLSGNESDNEEGFASDDDDDEDDAFFNFSHLPRPSPMLPRKPTCCRKLSYSSRDSSISSHQGWPRPSKADLPDSTDFVCGTFDEDKAVEDAYVSALEEKKRAKHGITPHDIDPGFPDSDPEHDSDYAGSVGTYHYARGRTSSSDDNATTKLSNRGILIQNLHTGAGKIRFQSPAVPRPKHSPIPKRRMISPPPPMSRRGSKHSTPPMSRRNSNEQCPPPAIRRCFSPPPVSRNNFHFLFSSRPDVKRTRSLPKNMRASNRILSSNEATAGHSPKGVPIGTRHTKKPRRKDGYGKMRPESWTRRGEGVEKMREVGLMLGKGKPPMPWLCSI